MITDRDIEVINYLDRFKVASTTTISSLFYPSLRTAQKRLKTLVEDKAIKRTREYYNTDYIYYTKKPKQIRHKLLLTEFHRELSRIATIVHIDSEVDHGPVISDGFVAFRYRGKNLISLIEVQQGPWRGKMSSYKKFMLSGNFKQFYPVFPLIFAISDKKVECEGLKIIQVKEDLSKLFSYP